MIHAVTGTDQLPGWTSSSFFEVPGSAHASGKPNSSFCLELVLPLLKNDPRDENISLYTTVVQHGISWQCFDGFPWNFEQFHHECAKLHQWIVVIFGVPCRLAKLSAVSTLNDHRPVALTPILMNCFKKFVLQHIKYNIPASLDSHHYAFRNNRSTKSATSTALHSVFTHPENVNSCQLHHSLKNIFK